VTLGPVDFPTLGWQVIAWIESYLVHGPGDVQGERIVIDDEMALHICHAYRLDPETGRRLIRRDILSRPKGRAKSEHAGMLVCAEALGPVRFDGWDANGEPVGRPITYPFIRCLATEEDQSGNTYDNVYTMLTEGEAANVYSIDAGITRTFIKEPGGGEITPSTASSAAKDGGKETFAVADETHLYVLPELHRMHATVRRNTGKRKKAEPWMLDTTTAYEPGEGSVAELAASEYEKLDADARLKRGVLYDHREAPALKPKDFANDKKLRKALKEVYGPFAEVMDLDRLVSDIRDPTAKEPDSRRYWLNQRVKGERRWVDVEAQLKPHARPDIIIESHELVTLGFDGSRTRDATALIGCRVFDGHLFVVRQADGSPAIWERPAGRRAASWEVPTNEVDAAVHYAMENLDVWRLYADPAFWQEYIDAWYGEWGQDKVVRWYTNRDTPMARAVENFETALTDENFSYDGDLILATHIGHAHRRKTRAGDVIEKESRDSTDCIDAAVAAVLAYEARGDAIADGALNKPKRSKIPVSL
jgi:phage terminase large subunit-like protein